MHWANGDWNHVFDEFPLLRLTRPLGAPLTEGYVALDGAFRFSRSFDNLDVNLAVPAIGRPLCNPRHQRRVR